MLRFQIPNMTCGGCVRSVTKVLQGVDPNARIEADLSTHEVRVDSTADEGSLRALLAEAGYPAEQHGEAAAREDDNSGVAGGSRF
jgi:copper chaperone